MGDAGVVGPELRIARQRLLAERPAEAHVLLGVHDDDLDPAVLGPERLGGREVRVPVAHARRPLARVEVVGDGIGEQRQGRGEQAHVEVLAPPAAQAMRERGIGDAEGDECRGQVGHGAAHLRRRMARHSRERHDAAHALGDRVVARPPRVRPVLTEARHRDVDRRRVHGAHRRVAEPELVGDPGQEVLDDDVGAAGQLEDATRADRRRARDAPPSPRRRRDRPSAWRNTGPRSRGRGRARGCPRASSGGQPRSRNPSVIALTSGIPVRAIALMRALTSDIALKGLAVSASAYARTSLARDAPGTTRWTRPHA